MAKKRYSPPVITDLGDAVEQTKGVFGQCFESWGSQTCLSPPNDAPPGKGN